MEPEPYDVGEPRPRNGRMFNRWADVATIIGMLDSDRRHPPAHGRQHDIEAMLQSRQ